MSNWIKFTNNYLDAFGITTDSEVTVYEGDMFNNPTKTDIKLDLKDVIVKILVNLQKLLLYGIIINPSK